MQIKLYGTSRYDRGGKVRWLLKELGQEYKDHWVKTDEDYENFLKINPLGQIPAMMLDEKPMIESGAICAFLADRSPEKGLAPAFDSANRPAYLQWFFYGISIGSFSSRIQIIEDIPEGEVKNNKMRALLEELRDVVDLLSATLSQRDYLLGDFSAADVSVGYHLYYTSLWPELNEVIESNSAVSRYMGRIKERPAAIAAKVFTYGE
jgi:glutathione S-transferase